MTAWQVNHFEMKTENGKQIWYWEDAVGNSCGRSRKWRYEVIPGDRQTAVGGTCAQGYPWVTLEISGTPSRVS